MASETVTSRAAELREQLDRHNYLYYVEARPEISDREFDKLLAELSKLEKAHPELAMPDSPTQRVGGQPIAGFEQVTHRVPMMSIDNSYNADDLKKFDSDVRKAAGGVAVMDYCVELKIDGVSMSLSYEDGQLTLGATRGKGDVGDNVTHNIKTIAAIPLKLRTPNAPKLFEVRGEVYMTRAELVRLNTALTDAGEQPYKNTRNLTAGTLKQLDPKECAKRKLSFFAYAQGAIEGLTITSQAELLEKLKEFGLPVNTHTKLCHGIDEVLGYVQEWDQKRHGLPYDTDGLVIKVNDFALRQKLGATAKVPRWAKAYKFEAEQGISKIGAVEFSVGKFGELTPVAEFDPPIDLAGTTVSRASMHNAAWVEKFDVRYGDTVVVEKAGEIIPQVVSVVLEARTGKEKPITWPTACPACGAVVEKEVTANSHGYYCTDVGRCPAQVAKRLISFARRERMDIEGLGDEVAKQLVESGLVQKVTDLYRVNEKQLLSLEGFAKTKAQNLLKGIEASKNRGLARLLPALNIYSVGESMAELFVESFTSLDDILAASKDDMAKVKGFGPKRAESVYEFFHSPSGDELVKDLRELGIKLTHEKKAAPVGAQPFAGKTLVVTGTLKNYDRKTIETRIKDLGGKSTGSVSKKTDYLLVGEEAGSKLDKARELGVTVLTEEEFEKLAGGA
ncbi:MAG: NAD-dependent DNA ligase LigA [Fimbriiglobus sp.]